MEFKVDERAVLVVIKQYDKSGNEVAISNISIPPSESGLTKDTLDANPSTCPHCDGKDWHHSVECYLALDLRQ